MRATSCTATATSGSRTSPDARLIEPTDALDGRIDPGRVFDHVTNLDGVPAGYRAMNDRHVLKVLIEL